MIVGKRRTSLSALLHNFLPPDFYRHRSGHASARHKPRFRKPVNPHIA